MRTLEKNKLSYWLVNKVGDTNEVDVDMNYTGEVIPVYSNPSQIRLATYPANGKITEEMFGKNSQLDLIAVSTDVVLTKDSLLFLASPLGDYSTTYDYRVDKINQSLNGYSYGLVRRT